MAWEKKGKKKPIGDWGNFGIIGGMKNLFQILLVGAFLSGCVNAHVNYGLKDVRPVVSSPYSAKTVLVAKLNDFRYVNKKSVSYHAHKKGAYNQRITFDPGMVGYSEIFQGVENGTEKSYYIAPDRLYWHSDGPLTEMRTRLAEHLMAAKVFRHAGADGSKGDYRLQLDVNQLLVLKGRRPLADGIGYLGISALFSSDEIIYVDVDWRLIEVATGVEVQSGRVAFREVERHSNFRAKNKPFRLVNEAVKRVGEDIIRSLAQRGNPVWGGSL